jgi:ABC-type transporter Mla subunit MlaD
VRRLLVIVALLGAVLGAALLLAPAEGASTYHVDVIFDDSQGLIPGQNVQIAGAKVGTIDDVVLTPDFKARVKMKMDGEFAPFKRDATCTIRPQGLIAEYYVDCDPGSPDAPALQGTNGEPPTVPVKNTTLPVSPQELFNIWTVPVRERLGLLLNTIGIGTAGLGSDFNEILRRANPSLAAANKVIALLRRQKTALATILDETDPILAKLAANGATFKDFIDQTARTSQITGERSRQLEETVRRLPALLDALEPSLRDLNVVVDQGTPVVRGLREAAPSLNALNRDIVPFARQVRPTLKALAPVLTQGAATLRRSAPLTRVLRSYAHNSLPAAKNGAAVLTNLRDTGVYENLLGAFYGVASSAARFDEKSHLLPAFITLNICGAPATTPVPGCSAKFSQDSTQQTRATSKTQKPAAATPARPKPAAATPAAPALPLLPKDPAKTVADAIKKVLDPVRQILGGKDQKDRDAENVKRGLLGYLLG